MPLDLNKYKYASITEFKHLDDKYITATIRFLVAKKSKDYLVIQYSHINNKMKFLDETGNLLKLNGWEQFRVVSMVRSGINAISDDLDDILQKIYNKTTK